MDDFQVTLSSNGSKNIFPDNKPSDFTVQLESAKELKGSWECALVDIFYKQSWHTFHKWVNLVCIIIGKNHKSYGKETLAKYDNSNYSGTRKFGPRVLPLAFFMGCYNQSERDDRPVISVTIPPGHYKDHVEIGKYVCHMIKTKYKSRYGFDLDLDYNYNHTAKTGNFEIRDASMYILIQNDDSLELIHDLGMRPQSMVSYRRTNTEYHSVLPCPAPVQYTDYVMPSHRGLLNNHYEYLHEVKNRYGDIIEGLDNFSRGDILCLSVEPNDYYPRFLYPPGIVTISALFIYLPDMIEYQDLPDTKGPLLALIPVLGDGGDNAYWSCVPPNYIRVNKEYLRSLHIQIHSATGAKLHFTKGDVLLRLHFRRKWM
jgi:hypothetical protein